MGELLQPGGVAALHHLGLGKCLEGIDATPVEGYCVCLGERRVRIPYPLLDQYVGDSDTAEVDKLANGNGYANGNGHTNGHANGNGHLSEKAFGDPKQRWHVQSVSGQKEGRSFHHGRLINSLRQACLDTDNLTVLEATVRELVFCEHTNRVIGVSAAFKPASTSTSAQEPDSTPAIVKNIYAPLTIVADGLFSKFRTAPGLRLPTPKLKSHFVGVILKDVSLPMERYGTVCLTPNGPVLLYQIGYQAREIRMLVDVAGKLPSVGDGSLKVSRSDRPVAPLLTSSNTSSTTTFPTSHSSCTTRFGRRSTHNDSEPCPTHSFPLLNKPPAQLLCKVPSLWATHTTCATP